MTRAAGSPPSAAPVRTSTGSCHCGAVRFAIDTDFPELTRSRRPSALMVKLHESRLRLPAGTELEAEYRFRTRTATHHFCRVCGIYPFHRKRVTPDYYGVNVHCLHHVDPAGIPVRRAAGAAMP